MTPETIENIAVIAGIELYGYLEMHTFNKSFGVRTPNEAGALLI